MDWWPASTEPILERYAKEDRSTIALTEERLEMALVPRFLNGDVAQMVERSLRMPAVRGSMLRTSNFTEEPLNHEKLTTGSNIARSQKDIYMYVQYAKGSIWSSTELAEKAISAPNPQGLPQKDVEGHITLLKRESKTSVWNKLLLLTPPVRHLNQKCKRLACEKHMDWWPATTKPSLDRNAIKDSVQLLH